MNGGRFACKRLPAKWQVQWKRKSQGARWTSLVNVRLTGYHQGTANFVKTVRGW